MTARDRYRRSSDVDKEVVDAAEIFSTDVGGIDWADALVAIMHGPDPVAGTAWEIGYFHGRKSILLVRTAIRPGAASSGPYNPMLRAAATTRLPRRPRP
jgi:nucleoside 2-deoxyribosyltransferase